MKYEAGHIHKLLDPQMKAKLASYELAYVVGKHKKPLSDCEYYVEFARTADPDSQVFKQMLCRRTSITRRLVEIHEFLDICWDLIWSYMLHESTDKAVGVFYL